MITKEEQELALADIEKSLDRLQALYNQYFMGIEKTEPLIPRKVLDRKIHALRRTRLRNTALKFRLQMQIQRYNTQATYWRRICRQIEEGTYKPHIMRAQRRNEAYTQLEEMDTAASQKADPAAALTKILGEEEKPPVYEIDLLGDFGLDDPFAEKSPIASHPLDVISTLDDPFDAPQIPSESPPAKKTAPEPSKPSVSTRPKAPTAGAGSGSTPAPAADRPQKAARSGDLDDAKLKKIYRTFLAAKKKCDEPTDNTSFEKIKKLLVNQYETKGGGVDFKVIIRDGKAAIKTVKIKNDGG